MFQYQYPKSYKLFRSVGILTSSREIDIMRELHARGLTLKDVGRLEISKMIPSVDDGKGKKYNEVFDVIMNLRRKAQWVAGQKDV